MDLTLRASNASSGAIYRDITLKYTLNERELIKEHDGECLLIGWPQSSRKVEKNRFFRKIDLWPVKIGNFERFGLWGLNSWPYFKSENTIGTRESSKRAVDYFLFFCWPSSSSGFPATAAFVGKWRKRDRHGGRFTHPYAPPHIWCFVVMIYIFQMPKRKKLTRIKQRKKHAVSNVPMHFYSHVSYAYYVSQFCYHLCYTVTSVMYSSMSLFIYSQIFI